jgi:predicted DNA-binding protein (UPF0251 family)
MTNEEFKNNKASFYYRTTRASEIETIETAWKELEELRLVVSNLQQQNTELLEDIAALRKEIEWLRKE